MRGTRGALPRCWQPRPRDANGLPGDPSGPKGLCPVSPVGIDRLELIPGPGSSEESGESRIRTRSGPEWTEQKLGDVLAYRGRWVYCVQRGAVTGRERRLMHLEGRTGSDDPRGRTDGSPPGGM
jgi:hypothetical protein